MKLSVSLFRLDSATQQADIRKAYDDFVGLWEVQFQGEEVLTLSLGVVKSPLLMHLQLRRTFDAFVHVNSNGLRTALCALAASSQLLPATISNHNLGGEQLKIVVLFSSSY